MQTPIKNMLLSVFLFHIGARAYAAGPVLPGPQLLCHRTANKDVPENTLESLGQAALLGCNVVEIDLRRTLDGEIVLNHDGLLERLTDGTGSVETSYYGELARSDAGGWMGERFAGLRVVRFEDALRLARSLGIRLVLDIKTPGIGEQVLEITAREGMVERVEFNGEWADIKGLKPSARGTGDRTAWVRFPVTPAQVAEFHRRGKSVVANFSDSPQEMDLEAMKAAVAAGVDAINVDYPRLGAEAVGRPVERTIAELTEQANHGEPVDRGRAVLQLAHYQGFPLRDRFVGWLESPQPQVNRAAALALLQPEYRPKASLFGAAVRSQSAEVRVNAAWAIGRLGAVEGLPLVVPLLSDGDGRVRAEAYLALSRLPKSFSALELRAGLMDPVPAVRGAAALALARQAPAGAAGVISERLQREMDGELVLYQAYTARSPKTLSPEEIADVTASFRCQMQMVKALTQLADSESTSALETQAFRGGVDFSQMNSLVAGFVLWDRIGRDPRRAVEALGDQDFGVADRAEWMLVHAGVEVLPSVREALKSKDLAARVRAMRIVSLLGDGDSLPLLRSMGEGPLAREAAEAVARIELLQRR